MAQREVEVAALMARSQAALDAEELLPLCFRCGAANTLISRQARSHSRCIHILLIRHVLSSACCCVRIKPSCFMPRALIVKKDFIQHLTAML